MDSGAGGLALAKWKNRKCVFAPALKRSTRLPASGASSSETRPSGVTFSPFGYVCQNQRLPAVSVASPVARRTQPGDCLPVVFAPPGRVRTALSRADCSSMSGWSPARFSFTALPSTESEQTGVPAPFFSGTSTARRSIPTNRAIDFNCRLRTLKVICASGEPA